MTDFEKVGIALETLEAYTAKMAQKGSRLDKFDLEDLRYFWQKSFESFNNGNRVGKRRASERLREVGKDEDDSVTRVNLPRKAGKSEVANMMLMFPPIDAYINNNRLALLRGREINREENQEVMDRLEQMFNTFDELAKLNKVLRYRNGIDIEQSEAQSKKWKDVLNKNKEYELEDEEIEDDEDEFDDDDELLVVEPEPKKECKFTLHEERGKKLKTAVALYVTHYHTLTYISEDEPELHEEIKSFARADTCLYQYKKVSVRDSFATLGMDFEELGGGKHKIHPLEIWD